MCLSLREHVLRGFARWLGSLFFEKSCALSSVARIDDTSEYLLHTTTICCRITSQMELGDVVPTGVDDGEASVGKAAVEEVADRAGYDTERELIREVCAYW